MLSNTLWRHFTLEKQFQCSVSLSQQRFDLVANTANNIRDGFKVIDTRFGQTPLGEKHPGACFTTGILPGQELYSGQLTPDTILATLVLLHGRITVRSAREGD